MNLDVAGIDEAHDWRGYEVNYSACSHRSWNKAGGCRLLHACVSDRYGCRTAARRAPDSRLLAMVSDPDASVRLGIAQRLSPQSLTVLRRDHDHRVRYEVAPRVVADGLTGLIEDEESMVQEIARTRSSVRPAEPRGSCA
ncbi:4Fe4S-binding leucine-rich repeat protein [Bradyrhizobium erythrophlei]|uniref:4Fe4S-binding leucine-rich repeat protein n=1 Tax=Bradyrhizobium erythrophlei TaxID=1437360 RepID=UPI0035E7EDCF